MNGQLVLDTVGHVQKTIGQTTTSYKGGVLSDESIKSTDNADRSPRRAPRRAHVLAALGPCRFPIVGTRESAGDCSSSALQFAPGNIGAIERLSLTLSPRSTAIAPSIAAVLQASGAAA